MGSDKSIVFFENELHCWMFKTVLDNNEIKANSYEWVHWNSMFDVKLGVRDCGQSYKTLYNYKLRLESHNLQLKSVHKIGHGY